VYYIYNPYHADEKIPVLNEIFEERRTVPGNYYDCPSMAASNLIVSFEGIDNHKSNNKKFWEELVAYFPLI
jgi:hypothetical protein